MSETMQRECDEASEPEEGDVEPYLEKTGSREDLLDKLRHLEAENSALALANESQREAYERCLDEVANHVVQALLNQKDLREECIKLKMRVFDLERQNRTLTELFAQKLHPQTSPLQQIPLVSVHEHSTELPTMGSESLLLTQSQADVKSNGDRTQNETASFTQAPPTSMEALSPFFKKKAHILEVLRKLEESDPLRFHPASCPAPHHDLGQALVSMEMSSVVSLSSGAFVSPLRPALPPSARCRHSSSDSHIFEYASGEGVEFQQAQRRSCQSCRALSQRSSLDSLLRSAQGRQAADLHSIAPPPAVDGVGQCHGGPGTDMPLASGTLLPSLILTSGVNGEESRSSHAHRDEHPPDDLHHTGEVEPPDREEVEPPDREEVEPSPSEGVTLQSQEGECPEACRYLDIEAAAAQPISLHSSPSHSDPPGAEHCQEQPECQQVRNGLFFSSNETSVSKKVAVDSYSPAPVPERTQPPTLSGKTKLALSPTSPPSTMSGGPGEVKVSPVSSPSRLLKFLKIPTIGERTQAAGASRLSPQLTRSSKIPCRNNNTYEVYHSPIPMRRGAAPERDRHTPSTSAAEPYPATHSAPTSPPRPDDSTCPPPLVKEAVYSSHSAPKLRSGTNAPSSSHPQRGSQKVPHYENVCPSDGTTQYLPYRENQDSPGEKSPQQEESLPSPASQHTDSSPGSADASSDQDASDQDTGEDSPAWHKPRQHFSLPSSASAVSGRAPWDGGYSGMKDPQQEHPATESSQTNFEPPPSTQPAARRGDPLPSSAAPKRSGVVQGKPQNDLSHLPFKERLAALGKLKSTEDLLAGPQSTGGQDRRDAQCSAGKLSTANDNVEKSKTADRQSERGGVDHRHQKYTDSLDGKPYPKTSLGGHPRYPGPFHEAGAKATAALSSVPKGDTESFSQRIFVAKAEGPKIKMGMSSTSEPPPVIRSYGKCPITQSPHAKAVPSPQNSPSKVPSKSPSKSGQPASYPRGLRPAPEDRAPVQRHVARPEDKAKLIANKKKIFIHTESLPPPPPLPPRSSTSATVASEEKKPITSGPPSIQSAIEQKVMQGIEENMLKLQEQDRGQMVETKPKASNGIASWFGLRKSKLPALSRKPEATKLKTNATSSLAAGAGGRDPKAGHRKVVESLNISKLMEKAEDLRKALEEERAYVNGVGAAMQRSGRGHSCEVVMDQTQGQLALMYRGVAADNFMQQLLNSPSTSCSGNRVDERDGASFGVAHRRLSFDSKRSRPVFSNHRNGISHTKSREEIEKGSDMVGKDDVPSDENLAESISSQHFTGSGASMRTLDSGIGTFPMPDYASSVAGKNSPKAKLQGEQGFTGPQGKHGVLMKVPRKARTLERELSSLEEVTPSVIYGSGRMEGKGASVHLASTIHEDIDAYGGHMQPPPTKNWTFPNLKGPAGSADVFLDVQGEVANQGTPPRRSLKPCPPPVPLAADPPSLPLPPQVALSRRGKGRGPEGGRDGGGGLELVKERPEDLLFPGRPAPALETPESLSDSLYDSLSSCGSQG